METIRLKKKCGCEAEYHLTFTSEIDRKKQINQIESNYCDIHLKKTEREKKKLNLILESKKNVNKKTKKNKKSAIRISKHKRS